MEQKYTLDTPLAELEKGLLFENNPDNIKEIVEIFNTNLQRKNIVRASKLSELQDKVFSQMDKRFDKHPDDFSNKDLLDYFKTIQDTISKTDTSLEMDSPVIQVNNQQINVDMGDAGLTREDKLKVLDVVKSIIGDIETKENAELIENDGQVVDGEFSEIREDGKTDGVKQ